MRVVHPGADQPRSAPAMATEPLGHVPALDGLRAVAVAAVLLFHGEVVGVEGGFLGVSVFFTLSGFLITSLLLREWARTPSTGVDLRRFWSRRFRRLLPASWLTIGLVVVMGALAVWDTDQLRALRGDVPWSLAELVNWHFIAQGTTYGASQTSPSPLEHFWSLAIEQQFYVLLPALLVLVLVRSRGPARRRLQRLGAVLVALTVLSATLNWFLARGSIDRAYFGTDTRAAELLIGALLAMALLRRVRAEGRARGAAIAAAAVGGVGLVVLFHVAQLSSRWLYPWGLLLTAACTAAVITGSLQRGPVARLLALSPFVLLGRISYGVYLLHWPVFLWLTPVRTGMDGAGLFALRVGVSVAAAAAMYHLVEMPVRSGRALRTQTAMVVAPLTAAALLTGGMWVTRDLPPPAEYLQPRTPGDLTMREVPSTTTTQSVTTTTTIAPPIPTTPEATTSVPPPTTAPPTVPPRRPTRVLLVGDSVAASLEDALGDALVARGISFATAAAPGCGLLTGLPADPTGAPLEFTRACDGAVPDIQSGGVAEARPDLVVGLSTWELGDRIVNGEWYQIGTPRGDEVQRQLFDQTIGRLHASGAAVAFLTVPDFVDSQTRLADADANRRARVVNAQLFDLAATHPSPVTVLRLDQIVCPSDPCPTAVDGVTLRPKDGGHFDSPEGARFVAERLADQIAALDLNTV